jgi:hypothetical protein
LLDQNGQNSLILSGDEEIGGDNYKQRHHCQRLPLGRCSADLPGALSTTL